MYNQGEMSVWFSTFDDNSSQVREHNGNYLQWHMKIPSPKNEMLMRMFCSFSTDWGNLHRSRIQAVTIAEHIHAWKKSI